MNSFMRSLSSFFCGLSSQYSTRQFIQGPSQSSEAGGTCVRWQSFFRNKVNFNPISLIRTVIPYHFNTARCTKRLPTYEHQPDLH